MSETREPSPAVGGGPAVRPSRAARLRLAFAGLVALVLLALAGLYGALSLLSAGEARAVLLARLEQVAGAPASAAGAPRLVLFPRPRLSLSDIVFERPGADIRIERVDALFDPLSALFGHAEISRLVLMRPDVRSPPDAAPRTLPELAGAFEPLLGALNEISEIEVRDAVLLEDSPGQGLKSFSFLLSQDDGEATAVGTAIWNGEPTDFSLRVADPAALLGAKPSALVASASAPALRASFHGTAEVGAAPILEGRLSFATPSPARLLEWLDDPTARIPDMGPFALDADILLSPRSLEMRGAEVDFAGGTGLGALELALDAPQPRLSGTLAFAALDLSPLAAAFGPQPGDMLVPERPVDVGFLKSFQSDLRLSVGEATLGRIAMSDLAGTLKLRNDALTVDLGDASLLDGRGQALARIDLAAPQPRLSVRAAIFDADLAATLEGLEASSLSVTGRVDVTAEIETPLASWPVMTSRAQTRATIRGRAGAIDGIDLSLLADPGTPALAGARGDGRLAFTSLAAELAGQGPDLRLGSLRLANREGLLDADGRLSMLDRTVRVSGRFVPDPTILTAGSGAFTPSQPISFTVAGQWPNPDVTVEAPSPASLPPVEDRSGGPQ